MNKISPESVISIIPAFKENSKLIKVLSNFSDVEINEICVIVDCVTEKYLKKIRAMKNRIDIPIHIISRKNRKGIGSAIREGIQYAKHRGYEVAVIVAGNNKDDPKEISRLIKPILKEGYDYVQGSRFLKGGKSYRNPLKMNYEESIGHKYKGIV